MPSSEHAIVFTSGVVAASRLKNSAAADAPAAPSFDVVAALTRSPLPKSRANAFCKLAAVELSSFIAPAFAAAIASAASCIPSDGGGVRVFNTGGARVGARMTIVDDASFPSSLVAVRTTTRSPFPRSHRLVSSVRQSSTSTQTSPSQRAVTVEHAPSGATTSVGLPIIVVLLSAVAPRTATSSRIPRFRSCFKTWSSFSLTANAAFEGNALP